MIKTKDDLKYYLEQDRLALHKHTKKPSKYDMEWRYEIALRYSEYYFNNNKKGIMAKIWNRRRMRISVMTSVSIPLNVCGPGLSIAHMGNIHVNNHARIGKNLRIQSGVTIGGVADDKEHFPILGDNVYLGSGCKVIGGVSIPNDCAIGANAVVCKSIDETHTTWAGVPAKKISDNPSWGYINKRVLENCDK